jgi:hypothetical protein
VLCVQRTGWGKSAVYFLATALLRERGAGPALIVSPLLALMRNQIAAGGRLGIRAHTINSTNRAAWAKVSAPLAQDSVDLLLIGPERPNNRGSAGRCWRCSPSASVCWWSTGQLRNSAITSRSMRSDGRHSTRACDASTAAMSRIPSSRARANAARSSSRVSVSARSTSVRETLVTGRPSTTVTSSG